MNRLFGLALISVAQATSPDPTWPNVWAANFSENCLGKDMTGTQYYDYTALKERIDRSDSGADRYCGSIHSEKTPCSHYVTGGVRYLFWPALGDCCSCCNDAAGCGIVLPNWVNADNGTYMGQKSVNTTYYSGLVDSWLAKGIQVRVR